MLLPVHLIQIIDIGEELSALEDYDPGIEAQKWIDSFKV